MNFSPPHITIEELQVAIVRSGKSKAAIDRLTKNCALEHLSQADRVWLIKKLSTDECYTPEPWIKFARAVFNAPIGLDVASCALAQQLVRADRFYTAEDNALVQPWTGQVWCNPPFSSPLIGKFADKFIRESDYFVEGLFFCNSSPNSLWNQRLQQTCDRMLNPSGRTQFWSEGTPVEERKDPKGNNAYQQVLFYFGPNPARFDVLAAGLGSVFRRSI